jgi:hypothetical protein
MQVTKHDWWGMLCTGLALASCAHKRPPPRQETFHYRSDARPLTLGDSFIARLDADSPAGYADAIKIHLPKTGTLTIDAKCASKVAVLIFGSGKKALVQTRSGAPIDLPLIDGEVFVVVRALRGTKGTIQVAIASSFVPAADGTAAAPKTIAPVSGDWEDDLSPPGSNPAANAKGNDLSLDDL